MSLQEKYQTLLELANQNGTNYTLSEADGVLHIDGTAPNEAAKQALWDEYNRIDPDYIYKNLEKSGVVTDARAGKHEPYDLLRIFCLPVVNHGRCHGVKVVGNGDDPGE